MPPSRPDAALNRLDGQVGSALGIANLVKGRSARAVQVRNVLVESSALRIFGSWEGFLEQCFLGFVMGEKTSEGYGPPSRYHPENLQSAIDLVSGPRGYFEWGNPDLVTERSRHLFGDDGLTLTRPLVDIKADLIRFRKLRNRIAHVSVKSDQDFEALVREIYGSVGLGTAPAELLTATFDRRMMVSVTNPRGSSLLEAYSDMVKALARIMLRKGP